MAWNHELDELQKTSLKLIEVQSTLLRLIGAQINIRFSSFHFGVY